MISFAYMPTEFRNKFEFDVTWLAKNFKADAVDQTKEEAEFHDFDTDSS